MGQGVRMYFPCAQQNTEKKNQLHLKALETQNEYQEWQKTMNGV